jgi:hypothetical protein
LSFRCTVVSLDDYRKQRRATGNTPRVVDPTILCSGTGYDFYNTLGSGFTTEYTYKFSKRFAYKVGIDLIVHSNYREAYDKNLAMSGNSTSCYYKQTNYEFYLGFLLGGKYFFGKRSSVFLNFSLNYITFSYHKRVNWVDEKINFWNYLNLPNFMSHVFIKTGYEFKFTNKLSSFLLIELNDDIYFGLGIKYKLKLK